MAASDGLIVQIAVGSDAMVSMPPAFLAASRSGGIRLQAARFRDMK